MQGDFEKEVSRRLKELNISPPPELWQRVEAALPPEKRRRRFAFWWWLLPLLGCLGTGIWLATDNKIKTSDKVPVSLKQPIANNKVPQQTASLTPADTFTSNTPDVGTKHYTNKTITVKEDSANKAVTIKKQIAAATFKPATTEVAINRNKLTALHPNRTNIPIPKDISIKEPVLSGSDSGGNEIQLNQLKNQPDRERLYATRENVLSPAKSNEDSLFSQKESDSTSVNTTARLLVPDQPADTAAFVKKDSLVLIQSPSKKKTAVDSKKKKVEWIAIAGIGKSRLTRIESYNNRSYSAPLLSSGPTGSQQSNNNPISQPKTGFNFSAGITCRQYFETRWNWQIGLRYQLLTASQLAGNKIDSLAGNRLDKSFSEMYARGTAFTYHSRMHQVQLSPGIGYTINPASHSSISVFAGGSVAYTLGSNLLLHDYRYYAYVRSATFSNKWFVSTNVGLDVFIQQKMHVGLLYEYGITNVAKPVLQSDFRWRQIQLQIGIPLSKQPKK